MFCLKPCLHIDYQRNFVSLRTLRRETKQIYVFRVYNVSVFSSHINSNHNRWSYPGFTVTHLPISDNFSKIVGFFYRVFYFYHFILKVSDLLRKIKILVQESWNDHIIIRENRILPSSFVIISKQKKIKTNEPSSFFIVEILFRILIFVYSRILYIFVYPLLYYLWIQRIWKVCINSSYIENLLSRC